MNLFNGISSGVFVVAALMALVILFLLSMFARLYRKAGPHEALVVYGARGTRRDSAQPVAFDARLRLVERPAHGR